MPEGDGTPQIAAKCLAAALSKARCEDAEPEPVKGTPRISHIACNSPFSALPPCRPSTSTRLSALARSSACANATPRLSGLNSSSNGRLWPSSAACFTSCTVSVTSQNQRSASGNASHSACADATETRRSLLVPPKRRVFRIEFNSLSSFRDGPKDQTRNLFYTNLEILRCAVRTIVRCFASPRNDTYGIPIRLISQCNSIPEFSL